MPDTLTDEQRQRIIEALYSGQKISAIKLYRDATGRDLLASKIFIEELEKALRAENPAAFANPAAAGCGTTAALLLGPFLLFGLWMISDFLG